MSAGLLSGGRAKSEINDGWVPNFTLNLSSNKWEGQIYFGAYLPIGDYGPTSFSYLHFWGNVGYRFNHVFSAGLHAEQLSGGVDATGGVNNSFYKMAVGFTF